MNPLNMLALTRYGPLGASSRLRGMQYWPFLCESGFVIESHVFFDDKTLAARYKRGGHSLGRVLCCYAERVHAMLSKKDYDLLWIEKEALPWWPVWAELALLRGRPYVLDFDDAWFHNYDLHSSGLARYAFGRRLDLLMAHASLVICGNNYLMQRAHDAGAKWVELLPTVIDLKRYSYPKPVIKGNPAHGLPRIVWVGSPSTQHYLQLLIKPLQALFKRKPFILRVIGGYFEQPGLKIECMPWTEETEVNLIAECDIGIMPLADSPWERGKCGYKLIQYMACGLPVVGSPVGVNVDIIENEINGFTPQDISQWENMLAELLSNPVLRTKMGAMGRQRVESSYCLQVTAPRLADLLRQATGKF